LLSKLTGCFQTDAFVGPGNQGNFLGAHIDMIVTAGLLWK
jgi:hypothetical protein